MQAVVLERVHAALASHGGAGSGWPRQRAWLRTGTPTTTGPRSRLAGSVRVPPAVNRSWASVRDMADTIIATNVVKRYGALTAVDDVSLSRRARGVLRHSRARTAPARRPCWRSSRGCARPDSGTVTVLGEPAGRETPSCCTRIGVQLQATAFFERLTAREQLAPSPRCTACRRRGWTRCSRLVGADRQGRHPGREALRRPGAAAVHRLRADPRPGDRLPGRADRRRWTRRPGATCGTCCGRSTIAGKTVVLTTHYMDEAEILCDRVAIMDNGKILQLGPPAELVRGLDAPVRISVEAGALSVEAARRHRRRRRGQRRQGVHRHRHPPPVAGAGRAGRGRRAGRAAGARRDPGGRVPRPDRTGVPGMRAFSSLSTAMLKGFYRDKMSLFFTILFPLFFIVIFGTVFANNGAARPKVIEIGAVPLIDRPAGGRPRRAWTRRCELVQGDHPGCRAASRCRRATPGRSLQQQGDTLLLNYSLGRSGRCRRPCRASSTRSSTRPTSRCPGCRRPTRCRPSRSRTSRCNRSSTSRPGMIGYGIAVGAVFGAALTLITWREKKLLRRLRLAPVSTGDGGGVPGGGVASRSRSVQLVLFVGISVLPFLGSAAQRRLVHGGAAGGRGHAGVPGDRPAGRLDRQDRGGRQRAGEPDHAADGVPVRRVHPARGRARVAGDGVEVPADGLPGRGHEGRDGARRGAVGGAAADRRSCWRSRW